MIEANVIADSTSAGKRITTFKLRYPKFIHGEFMTHRVISRNASSSRAIPTAKLIEEVRNDALRAGPIFWGKNQSGMQAAEELDDNELKAGWLVTQRGYAKKLWANAAIEAARAAQLMADAGVHKQIVNRVLEPFSHINVVATATEWDNFFGLRLHKDAQPEMRALAETMWAARAASAPNPLVPGQWHLPFVNKDGAEDSAACMEHPGAVGDDWIKILIKVSVARCARVSYESFYPGNKQSVIDEDLKLYERLVGAQPLHASPAEHQATPDDLIPTRLSGRVGGGGPYVFAKPSEHGNFDGWRQYRKMLDGEAVAPLPEGYK